MSIIKCQMREALGAIAQLVEQRTENPCVTGSIPVGTTQKKRDSFRSLFCAKGDSHQGSYLATLERLLLRNFRFPLAPQKRV